MSSGKLITTKHAHPIRPGTKASMLAGFAVLIEMPLLFTRILGDLQHHVGEVVALLLATSIFYIVSVWWVTEKNDRSHEPPHLIYLILIAGAVFRVTIFPLPPAFSDDLYRYRWEGKIQAEGHNPYRTTPQEAGQDITFPKVDGKAIRAVYGPLLELEERFVYRLIAACVPDPEKQVFWFKIPSALADLGIAAAIMSLLRARGLPLSRVLIYFWCPLPIFVFFGTGHNDALVVLLVAIAMAAAARGSRSMAYLWLSLAVAAKFWPLILFPSFTGWKPDRVLRAIAILFAVAFFAALPFGSAVFENRDFTSGFLGGWRNNDSLFGIVLALAKDVYRAKYLTYALVAASAILISLTRWTLEQKLLATVTSLLAFSSNVHPWYLTWLLPMLTVEPVAALLLLISLVPLFYEPVIGWVELHQWTPVGRMRWLVYGAVLFQFAVTATVRRFSKARS
jgi:hypothetical protein